MINVQEIDLWLMRKLEEPWSSGNVSNLLDSQILEKVAEKWTLLEVGTKLKLLFSFLTLKPESKSKINEQIEKIVELGMKDEESEWVQVISEFFSLFSKEGKINFDVQNEGFRNSFEKLNEASECTVSSLL